MSNLSSRIARWSLWLVCYVCYVRCHHLDMTFLGKYWIFPLLSFVSFKYIYNWRNSVNWSLSNCLQVCGYGLCVCWHVLQGQCRWVSMDTCGNKTVVLVSCIYLVCKVWVHINPHTWCGEYNAHRCVAAFQCVCLGAVCGGVGGGISRESGWGKDNDSCI